MLLDPAQLPHTDMYRVLISAVVPRPIALVSTRSAAGAVNLAPFSYFNALASAPPLIGVSINDRGDDPKDTLRNIRETGEFVVNVVNRAILEPMVCTAGEWPRTVNEFEPARFTMRASHRVAPPAVAESPLQLECRLHREIPLGNCFLIVGEVVFLQVDDAVLTDGRIDAAKLDAVGRLGGELYAPLGEVVKVTRPKVSRTTGAIEG